MNAKRIACGADFRFGKFAAGDTEWLKKLCEAHGGEMHVVPTVEYKGERISATRIRKAIENGEMEDVTAMLGRPFSFCFEVVHGNHIGHTIARRPLTRISRRASCCRASACTPPPCMWTAKPTAA